MPHCNSRKSASVRAFSARCRDAFQRLRLTKSEIRVFLLRQRGICPEAVLAQTQSLPCLPYWRRGRKTACAITGKCDVDHTLASLLLDIEHGAALKTHEPGPYEVRFSIRWAILRHPLRSRDIRRHGSPPRHRYPQQMQTQSPSPMDRTITCGSPSPRPTRSERLPPPE